MPASIPIGNDIFRSVRERGLEYIDKTQLIQEVLDDEGTLVLLLPRPRRFGKTLNMTMLEAFLARRSEDLSHLFEGLRIWSAGEKYRAHFQRYPTIFLTFKNLKPDSEAEWQSDVARKLSLLYRKFDSLKGSGALDALEIAEFDAIREGRADSALQQDSLRLLSEWLHRAYGEQVLILVDEYDTPVHAAWRRDQARGIRHDPLAAPSTFGEVSLYDRVVKFLKDFFGAALKSNEHLYRGVLTGVLRVSKESIFSDLNNPKVKTLLDPEFSDAFGFSEEEVRTLCERQGQLEHLTTIRTWYNGYRFGGRTIYNPWSVLSFLDSQDKTPQAFWLNSSSNDLIKELVFMRGLQVHELFQTLLEGGSIETEVDVNMVFPELDHSQSALLTMLLFSGYLKAERVPTGIGQKGRWALSIPNLEVREVYQATFKGWLDRALGGFGQQTTHLLKALMSGDEDQLEEMLGQVALQTMSCFDRSRARPEAFYHGLMLGLLAALEPEYRVRSNRESGRGRPDMMILPARPGQAGAVLELKVAKRNKSLEQALAEGEEQLLTKRYDTEVKACGAEPLQRWSVAFDGKDVRVKRVEKRG